MSAQKDPKSGQAALSPTSSSAMRARGSIGSTLDCKPKSHALRPRFNESQHLAQLGMNRRMRRTPRMLPD